MFTIFRKEKAMKILVVGGATQDIFVNYQGADQMRLTKNNFITEYALFASGDKCEVHDLFIQTGGGATNSAVSFKTIGFDVICYCMVGIDNVGKSIITSLNKHNIDTSYVIKSNEHLSGQSIIINASSGERTIFAYRGANSHLPVENIINHLDGINQIYITSLSNESSLKLPELARAAYEKQIPVAINPGKSQLIKGMKSLRDSLKYISVLILNGNEAQLFMHTLINSDAIYKEKLETKESASPSGMNLENNSPYLMKTVIPYADHCFSMQKFFSLILSMGPSIVIVTNGKNGVYVATKERIYFHPSLPITVINSVGAGDAFGSTFIASIASGKKIEDALRMGVINSASVLQHVGAKTGLLPLDKLLGKLEELDKSLLQTL